jgi:hypothetical protein
MAVTLYPSGADQREREEHQQVEQLPVSLPNLTAQWGRLRTPGSGPGLLDRQLRSPHAITARRQPSLPCPGGMPELAHNPMRRTGHGGKRRCRMNGRGRGLEVE